MLLVCVCYTAGGCDTPTNTTGIAPDPKKVEAIKSAPAPTTSRDVRRFLGMATYCAKFTPNFSAMSTPFRELTRKDEP